MRRRERILPDVPVFHLLWGIPESFGGMTTVALQRVSLLADTDRRRLDVLTLSPDLAPRTRQRELYRDGLISRRVRIRNLWAELRRAPDKELVQMSAEAPVSSHSDHERLTLDGHADQVLADDQGRELQAARVRADGTLLLTDRRDVRTRGKRGGRRLTLYDRGGRPVGEWGSARDFYHAWLRFVTRAEQSVIICDSAFVGGFMHTFTSPRTSLIQVVHSHHHDGDSTDLGRLTPGKLPILKNADRYDLIAVLTERQRRHLLEEDIASDNLVTIPNPFHGRASAAATTRSRGRGIVVSRLTEIKRLDHAVLALASCTSTVPTLDVYGGGEDRDRLERCIADQGMEERVRLHGHDPHARNHFARSSFSLLTSRTEGQSLTIVESMAHGCIPIAYDIDYGPSDIITDGVDGFLVPAGRPDALARAVDAFLEMDEERVAGMRDAAIDSSRRFSSESIAARWAGALHRVVRERSEESGGTTADVSPELAEVSTVGDHVVFAVRVKGLGPEDMVWAKLALVGRGRGGYARLPLQVSAEEGGELLRAELSIDRITQGSSSVLDLFFDARISGARVRRRIAWGIGPAPTPLGDLEVYATKHGNASIRRAG